jgi:hypothetical protein
MQVASTGGDTIAMTMLDTAKGELGHRFPSALPDGDHFLYAVLPGKNGKFAVYAGSLKDPSHSARTYVGEFDAAPIYAEPGYLLYARQGTLVAQPFDMKALKTTGDPISLEDEPATILDPAYSFTAGRSVSLSGTGALAYYATPSNKTVASWFDLSGAQTASLSLPPAYYDRLVISHDGKRAVAVRSTSASESTLWMIDLARGTAQPLIRSAGRNDSPVWAPTDDRIVFASDRSGKQEFFVKYVDDARPEQVLYSSPEMFKVPADWSHDGSTIVFDLFSTSHAQDVMLLDATGKGEPVAAVHNTSRDVNGVLSPDGKWLAYASDVSGEAQVWIQPVKGPGSKVQVSQAGGLRAWWSARGDQILWVSNDLRSLWRSNVRPGPVLGIDDPVKLGTLPAGILYLDMTPDRTKVLAITPERLGIGSATVVLNWRKALEGKR